MKSRIELFGKITRTIFELLFVMLLTIFFENVLLKQEVSWINRAILVVLYLVSFVVKNVARMRIVALVVHVVLGASMFLTPIDNVSRWMFVVILCYLMFSSMEYIGQRNKLKPLEDPPWPSFFIIVIMYLFGIYTKSYTFMNSTYIFALLMMVTYYLMTYLDGLKKYVNSTKEVEETHLKKVIKRNNVIVFWITLLLVVGMVVVCLLDYSMIEAVLKKVGTEVLRVFASVFMIFALLFDNVIKESSGRPDAFNVDAINSMKGHAKVALDSSIIFLYIACGLIALIVVKNLLKFVIKLLFARNKSQDDIVEIAEDIEYAIEETPKKKIFKRLTVKEKIRKKYKDYIEKFKYDIRLSNTRTCRDIADEIKECELGSPEEITQLYAEIRYGNAVADKNMLKRINTLARK
ncbi:MAG: hypothetical protein IKJ73_05175 [Lachnospiraceae bacterium]|nr:hypothetical protein [Lachnospiraceae bacterium]